MIWLLALLALLPVALHLVRRPMDRIPRAEAPGEFARLPLGETHYQWHGEGKEITVLVHGLTTPMCVWTWILPHLRGCVLTYDLYGRGYSDRPRGRQDLEFFSDQLVRLLDHLEVGGKVRLIGYSMGGAIVADFAHRHPERVSRLVLIAPAGFAYTPGWFDRLVMAVPGAGEYLIHVFGGLWHGRGIARGAAEFPAIAPCQMRELRYRGFLGAVLSSQRHALRQDLTEVHRAIGTRGLPVTAIWGSEDTVIPPTGARALAAANPQAKQHILEDATHALGFTKPEEIAAIAEAAQAD